MITGIFALLICIGCFWFSFKFLKTYAEVKKWKIIDAMVVSKSIKLHKKYSTSRSPYAVLVDYSYVYDNIEYKGNTVYLAELLGGQANHMESTAKRVISGMSDKIQIFVNPKKPEQSVIFCEGLMMYIFIIIIGLFALLTALANFIN